MILDALLQFSSAQNLAQAQGTYVSTNIIDLGVGTASAFAIPAPAQGGGARDIGIGDKPAMKFMVQVGTTFTGAGATLSVALQGAIDNGAGAPAAFSTWWVSPVYALATLNAGSRLFDMDMPRPPDGVAIPRFIQLLYTIGGATSTAGTVSAYLVIDRDDQIYQGTDNSIMGGYPPGIVIAN